MAPRKRSEPFQQIVLETTSLLKRRGLRVTLAAVEDVVEGLAESAAHNLGLGPEEALMTLEATKIADLIVIADERSHQPSVRRVREDPGTATLTAPAVGQLLKAIGQVAKYAIANHDGVTADHAADLVTELGTGVLAATESGIVTVPRGVLSETAQILDRAAERFAASSWSTCPCGKEHGQKQYDSLLPDALQADAELARQLLIRAVAAS